MEVGSLPIIIWGQKYIIPTFVQGNLAAHNLFHLNPIGVAIGLLLGGIWMNWRCIRMPDALYPSWEPNSCSSIDFDAGEETHRSPFDIERWWAVCPGWRTTSVIITGDLELPSGEEEEEEEDQPDQTPVEAIPAPRRKRKETAKPVTSGPSPPPIKSKRLRKRTLMEYMATEETATVPTATSDTDEELRKAFEAVDQEKELEELEEVREGPQEKAKIVEEEEEIPTEVIAESIALAQKQQEDIGAGLTSSELALFKDPEAEQSIVVPTAGEQSEQFASEPVEQVELPVAVPEGVLKLAAAPPEVMVEVPRSASLLAVMTSPLKPSIVAMPIYSFPGSSAKASFADPELAEFEAMDLDA
ncbi:unnamed protein product [Prunus armeniaca]